MKSLSVIAILFLTGCKTCIKPISITGNKKNGIVNLTYSLQSAGFKYVINPQQEINIAKKKCIELGYKTAEPIGKQVSKCVDGCCKTKQIVNSYIFALVSLNFDNFYCQTKEIINSYKCLNK